MTNKKIGETMKISDQTVKNNIRIILAILEAPDRTVAVITALRNGWIPWPEVATCEEVSRA